MTTISRRRFLAAMLPASFTTTPSLPASAPARPSVTRLEQLERQLKRMQQGWPDRALKELEPEPKTLEELTAQVHKHGLKIEANDGVDRIHSLMIAEGYKWIRYLAYMMGGRIWPPARGDV